jgi:hypothetical protein
MSEVIKEKNGYHQDNVYKVDVVYADRKNIVVCCNPCILRRLSLILTICIEALEHFSL